MAHALTLGRRGQGAVWPNPAVGCVIVAQGRVVGRGWTQPGGRPHAERVALDQAGPAASWATAYVTLEPCAHHGHTPPCADALAAAGVTRVVTAMGDPDARVAGRGHARLRQAGVEVVEGVCEAVARRDHAGFLRRLAEGRPLVTLKLAASFDGRIATASGASRWITGPDARRAVHAMRLTHDAIMVGGGTVRADDPVLTVRGMGQAPRLRVVLSQRLDLPTEGRFAASVADAPLWLLHGPDAPNDRKARWTEAGARCVEVPLADGILDVKAALEHLGQAGLTRVFCEGGGVLAASLLRARLVDRLLGFTAGLALGSDGTPAIGPLGLDTLAGAPRFALHAARSIGGDVLHEWDRLDDGNLTDRLRR
ncbi:riboflavin biosynthesis protein RibD [Oceaniovalibus guishaninsula JLT2003]|uniref:Riboflavin biosynthesis protein RibD n=2 Tax=Oceaniovalibus TaxID=1207070 RepID=K2HT92_9RHOB|nr:bifunctional diaminohydroxyphosphoribosylaminopyrimidine deaminase/5-amino-6-(5-phosphoribosylamino)uracil reductase RibD [Oceaniovalibus guishaninsula]EKE45844.1 riboflavin biosynthesis protein RibD [Oceaniovalibus guishaninsula JLT2003]